MSRGLCDKIYVLHGGDEHLPQVNMQVQNHDVWHGSRTGNRLAEMACCLALRVEESGGGGGGGYECERLSEEPRGNEVMHSAGS